MVQAAWEAAAGRGPAPPEAVHRPLPLEFHAFLDQFFVFLNVAIVFRANIFPQASAVPRHETGFLNPRLRKYVGENHDLRRGLHNLEWK
jgi:hypothetical protein